MAAAALIGCLPAAALAEPAFAPTRFTATVRGTGPDVILIPGLTAGPDVWNGIVAALPGYRCHLLHVGGMAGAPAAGNASGAIVSPLADEIARYIEARGLRRPALIGHSMGGTLAMMVAARRPELVGRLMVVDMLPQPSGLVGSSPDRARAMAERLRALGASPAGRMLVGSLIGSFGTDGRSDPDVVARAMEELAAIDLTADLPRIAAPLTVVYANRDERSRARTDAAYASAYAGARDRELVRIDGSGHMIMFDQPARLAEAVRQFLAR
jgi:pimeloyl-ACP methyl ester carboxylesterase